MRRSWVRFPLWAPQSPSSENGHLGAQSPKSGTERAQKAQWDESRQIGGTRRSRRATSPHLRFKSNAAVEIADFGRVAHEMAANDRSDFTALHPSRTRTTVRAISQAVEYLIQRWRGAGSALRRVEPVTRTVSGKLERGCRAGRRVILDGMTHRVGPKGQVVIPKELRDELGIEPGDEVNFWRHDDHVAVRPVGRAELRGRFRGHQLTATLEAERQADRAASDDDHPGFLGRSSLPRRRG